MASGRGASEQGRTLVRLVRIDGDSVEVSLLLVSALARNVSSHRAVTPSRRGMIVTREETTYHRDDRD